MRLLRKHIYLLYSKATHCVLLAFVLFSLNSGKAYAQANGASYKSDVDNSRLASDTVPCSVKELFSFRTNIIDWALATPNFGVEIDLSRLRQQRYSVVLSGKFNPSTQHTLNPRWVYNVSSVKGEFRKYWRTGNEGISIDSVEFDTTRNKFVSKLNYFHRRHVSGRFLKNPRYWRAYYVGAYGAYGNYSIALGGDGIQGQYMSFGLSFGYSVPLYKRGGYSGWDVDLGISGGLGSHKYRKYRYADESSCYVDRGETIKNLRPGIHDIHVSLVYRFRSISEKVKYGAERFKIHEDSVVLVGMQRRAELAQALKDSLDNMRFNNSVEEVLASAKQVLAMYKDTTSYHYIILKDAISRIDKDLRDLRGNDNADFLRKVYSRELEYYRHRSMEEFTASGGIIGIEEDKNDKNPKQRKKNQGVGAKTRKEEPQR